MHSFHSLLKYYSLFSGIKLSIRSFCFISVLYYHDFLHLFIYSCFLFFVCLQEIKTVAEGKISVRIANFKSFS